MKKTYLFYISFFLIFLILSTACSQINLSRDFGVSLEDSSGIKLEYPHLPELDFLEIYVYEKNTDKLVDNHKLYTKDIIINPEINLPYYIIIEGKAKNKTYKSPPIYITFYDKFPESGYKFKDSTYFIDNDYFFNNEEFLIIEIPDNTGENYTLQIQMYPKNSITPDKPFFLLPETVIPIYIENVSGNFIKVKSSLITENEKEFEWEDQYALIKKDLNSYNGYIYVSNWDLRNPIFTELPKKIVLNFEEYIDYEGFHELWRVLPFPGELNGIKTNRLLQYKIEENSIYPIQDGKNAIIFIHGHQGGYGFLRDSKYSYWGNDGRAGVWSKPFSYILGNLEDFYNFHYYEYIYDSNFYSAEEYAKNLNLLITKSNFFKSYDEIYIVAHSMGSLVSRYLLDEEYNNKKIGEYDKIKKVFTLDGVHHGSPLQNFIQILSDLNNINNDFKEITYLKIPRKEGNSEKSLLLSFLQVLYLGFTRGFEEILFSKDFINLSSDELISIIKSYPQIMSVFVNTGNIGPFKGGRSFVYDEQEYLNIISQNQFSNLSDELFEANEKLYLFNENYAFFDKFITISSYIENINVKSVPNESIIDSISMGILSNVMNILSIGATKEEIENDGLVNVFSQEALNTGDKNMIWKYNNMNHLEITMNSTVCEDILSYIISNK